MLDSRPPCSCRKVHHACRIFEQDLKKFSPTRWAAGPTDGEPGVGVPCARVPPWMWRYDRVPAARRAQLADTTMVIRDPLLHKADGLGYSRITGRLGPAGSARDAGGVDIADEVS